MILFRDILAYVYIPVVQRALDEFREVVWNNQRGRKQEGAALPKGKPPQHIYDFPETYGDYSDYGIELEERDLNGLLEIEELEPIFRKETDEYIIPELREVLDALRLEHTLGDLDSLMLEDAAEMFCSLKKEFKNFINEHEQNE